MSSMDSVMPKLIHSSHHSHNNNNNNNYNNNKNNNNDDCDDDNTELVSAKKKWTMSSLSSLNEVTDYDEPNFNSTENLRRAISPPPMLRRDSVVEVVKEEKLRTRRKSWHVKFEKKRRKGVRPFGQSVQIGDKEFSGSASPITYEKHKRFSLWNVFPLDHWPRSRRSSTDFHKSTEKLPFFRGKSRSVDHGVSTPFDFVSQRSKVESRFQNVDRLTRDADGDSCIEGKEKLTKKKMQTPPLIRTITYKESYK